MPSNASLSSLHCAVDVVNTVICLQGITAFDLLDKSVDIPLIAIANRANRRDVSLLVYATRQRGRIESSSERKPICVQQKDIQQNLAVKVIYKHLTSRV